MTISHMTRRPSFKPWMLDAGISQFIIAKGGSDMPSGFIPGASPWMISDVMLMKTCGLTLKIAGIRNSSFVLFCSPFFNWAFCCQFFYGMLLCFMDILFTVSITVKLFLFITVYCVSTVLPLVNSKAERTIQIFTEMCLNVTIIVHVDIQFPTKKLSLEGGLQVLHANT